MTDIRELSAFEKSFLHPYLPQAISSELSEVISRDGPSEVDSLSPAEDSERPFVTLTYACSLDSMISLAPGVRTTLSGAETKSMTHYLRLCHDAILVGVGTAIADDPALNCRYPGSTLETQPQPLILDPSMRWNASTAKVSQLSREGKGKLPWILHHGSAVNAGVQESTDFHQVSVNEDTLSKKSGSSQSAAIGQRPITWINILQTLKEKGLQSVMVEGGATIINDLLSQPSLVDVVIITIAPTFLGQGGTSIAPAPRTEQGERVNATTLDYPNWLQFGKDVVLCGRLRA